MKLTKLSLITLSLALGAFALSACDQRPAEAKYTDRPVEYQAFSGATKHTKDIKPVEGHYKKEQLFAMTKELVQDLFDGNFEKILPNASERFNTKYNEERIAKVKAFFSEFKGIKSFGDARYLGLADEKGVECQASQIWVEFDNGKKYEFSTCYAKDGVLHGVWFDYKNKKPH